MTCWAYHRSEGLLAVVTEVTVKIIPAPQSVRTLLIAFASNEDAGRCVAAVIGQGIIPAGIEMMDKLAIDAAEAFCHPGYPQDCEALLIVELDGPAAEVDNLIEQVRAIAKDFNAAAIRISETDEERLRFWTGRKAAFRAMGNMSPDYYCMDGTIPRGQLSHVLMRMKALSSQYRLRVANVFHAGDGNLHPLILYDANQPGDLDKAEAFGADILRLCVAVGGVLTVSMAWAWKNGTSWPRSSLRLIWISNNGASAHSIRPSGSIQARSFRPRAAAPSWGGCMCTGASCRF